jgi:hypothetical protein
MHFQEYPTKIRMDGHTAIAIFKFNVAGGEVGQYMMAIWRVTSIDFGQLI